jgi:hypothetical protein
MDNHYRVSLIKAAKLEIERMEQVDEASAQIMESLTEEVVKLENKLREIRLLCNKWEEDVLRVNMLAGARDCLEFCASELSCMLNEVKV